MNVEKYNYVLVVMIVGLFIYGLFISKSSIPNFMILSENTLSVIIGLFLGIIAYMILSHKKLIIHEENK